MHAWVRQHADLSGDAAWRGRADHGPTSAAVGATRVHREPPPRLSDPFRREPMPIATPEVYAEMLDEGQGGRLRLPGHQRAPRRRP